MFSCPSRVTVLLLPLALGPWGATCMDDSNSFSCHLTPLWVLPNGAVFLSPSILGRSFLLPKVISWKSFSEFHGQIISGSACPGCSSHPVAIQSILKYFLWVSLLIRFVSGLCIMHPCSYWCLLGNAVPSLEHATVHISEPPNKIRKFQGKISQRRSQSKIWTKARAGSREVGGQGSGSLVPDHTLLDELAAPPGWLSGHPVHTTALSGFLYCFFPWAFQGRRWRNFWTPIPTTVASPGTLCCPLWIS